MSNRKLASIQKVIDIRPIYTKSAIEADKIEQITVLGWRLVAKKGEFKVGDLCVYLEVDSILNKESKWVQEHASFMAAKKWIVKTIKFNNMVVQDDEGDFVPVVSQGLALPITILDSRNFTDEEVKKLLKVDIEEGADLTYALNIIKHEPNYKFNAGLVSGGFPDFIPKTDETRIQSVPKALDDLKGKPYYITLKMDGTSLTAWYDNGLHVASRSVERVNDGNVYWENALKYKLGEILEKYPNFAIQGEVVGEKIQNNLLQIHGTDFYVFNIYNIEDGTYLDIVSAIQFCYDNGLKHVEVLEINDNFNYNLHELEEYAKGNYDFTNNPREGIVVRAQKHVFSKWLLGRLSFKVINVDYLLLNE